MKSNKYLTSSIYPLVIALVVLAHWLMMKLGFHVLISTYVPVLSAALLIHLLENLLPYQKHWLPNKSDLGNDAIFMIAVQIVLPKALAFLAVTYLLVWFQSMGWVVSVWPQDLNPFIQVAMMLLCADFLRYWLHRAYHELSFMWVFHAVHHSPQKLYWMNVGRFHPLDKASQYLFDALPFVILGVSEEVLALYFVFYAVNGFFQHCNINVSLGVLNYLISGPELHRWHHSINAEESNQNYGNNLIVWDLAFGTYFLPKNRLVGDLGLINRQYPQAFLPQMKAPFAYKLDKYTGNNQE